MAGVLNRRHALLGSGAVIVSGVAIAALGRTVSREALIDRQAQLVFIEEGSEMSGQNYLWNGNFRYWGQGPNSPPTGWTTDHAGAVSRAFTQSWLQDSCVALTRSAAPGSNNNVHISFNAHSSEHKGWPTLSQWRGKTVTAGFRVKYLITAPSLHLQAIATITDARSEAQSLPHSGTDDWEWITVSKVIDNDAQQLVVQMGLVTGNGEWGEAGTCYIDNACLMIGESAEENEACFWTGRTLNLQFSSGDATVAPGSAVYLGQAGKNVQIDYVAFPTPFDVVFNAMETRAGAGPGTGQNFTYDLFPQSNSSGQNLSCVATGQGARDVVHQMWAPRGTPISPRLTVPSGATDTFHRVSLIGVEYPRA